MSEFDVVGKIREKTEEEDINSILKASLGGYTKKSVMEYLAQLRKKQQLVTDTFNSNMQVVFEEKERIKAENEELSMHLQKAEADYRVLSETITVYKLDKSEYTLNDVMDLKVRVETLEKGKKDLKSELNLKAQEIENLNLKIKEEEIKLKQSSKENDILNEQIVALKTEIKEESKKISKLSNKVFELKNEAKFLREIVSEGNVAELNKKINELIVTIDKQSAIIDNKNVEISVLGEKNIMFTEKAESLQDVVEKLSATVNNLMLQNSKKDAAIEALEERLKSELERSFELIKSKSDTMLDNFILERKLESVNIKNAREEVLKISEKAEDEKAL
ncbi:MAG: hypothetical protein VB120_03680 [Lachnospiraceae bacterium]|nr:hypothetical protein [Lachnospiraceae bacterium]